jgi:hypothetical protein
LLENEVNEVECFIVCLFIATGVKDGRQESREWPGCVRISNGVLKKSLEGRMTWGNPSHHGVTFSTSC